MTIRGTEQDIRRALEGLYRGILGREPDVGIEGHIQKFNNGRAFGDLVNDFLESPEYAARITGSQSLLNDQTQFGELEHLLRFMVNDGRDCLVVDVGARGKERSNSWDLMKTFGWRGILVEANPNLIPSIHKEFHGLDARVVNCAISDFDGEADFFFGINDDVSSLQYHSAAVWGEPVGQTRVQVRRLGGLLAEHGVPPVFDLLSLDIEGVDVKVLNDVVAFGYRPRYVVIEACLNYAISALTQLPVTEEVLATYEIVARTPANLILKSKAAADFPDRVEGSSHRSPSTWTGTP
ncbi:FkbM family methyltransferase [Brevundimonas sp. NIBR11]|uniref:FkbM family methyltransferase n=1 Tax=Brevundimonas sp. NIBR11 TaxID=3015999 RepID=UPI0022F0036B|nr:FkbM family methyltransferase [Brevundimonas sp. NIBR11]WGM31583.1 hypothetical protein KKHFBJBL_01830 [Brevundimonas sp. NIBR11]